MRYHISNLAFRKLCILGFLAVGASTCLAADRKPNVILIVAESAGNASKPSDGPARANMEALAKIGVTFADAFAASCEAEPSNLALLSGRYPQRFGFDAPPTGDAAKGGLDPAPPTIAQYLKDAGYVTAAFGDANLGGQPPHGFDEVKSAAAGESAKDAASSASAFIDHHTTDSFFAYLAVPGDGAQVDEAAGTLFGKLREHSLEENTLIIFVNDEHPTHWTLMDPGIRAPFVVSWQGKIPGGQTFDQSVSQLDLAPTILAAAGVAPNPDWHFDGTNLLPLLQGQSKTVPEETLYWRLGPQYAVQQGDWKLVKAGASIPPRLYYLQNDPVEQLDLFKQQGARDKELQSLWDTWNAANQPPRWVDARWNGPANENGAVAGNGGAKRNAFGPWKSGDSFAGNKAPAIAGKELEISAQIDAKGADGVIISQGASGNGFAIYITGGKPAFAVREKKNLTAIIAKEALGTGHFEVKATLGAEGAMTLSIDGKQVAEGKAPGLVPAQPRAGLFVGKSGAGAVGDYQTPGEFVGQISDVRIKITGSE